MKIRILTLLLLLYQWALGQSVMIDANTANPSLIAIQSETKGLLVPRLTSTQRSAIIHPSAGLMIYDTTTNSYWYFNGTNWGEMSAFSINTYWQINGANQQSEASSNVGINTFAARAKFQIVAKYRPQAIFGTDYSGISFIANPPGIGFNIYNDSTNTNRNLSLGYGFLQEFDTSTGKYSLKPLVYRAKDSVNTPSNPPYYLTNIGQFGIGLSAGVSAQTKFFNSYYSKLGENAPEIKTRIYTGTTSGSGSNFTIIHLEMQSSRVLKVNILIECGGSRPYVPPNQCGDSFYGGHCYRYFLDNNGFLTIVHEGNASEDTYAKPYKAFVIYTQ